MTSSTLFPSEQEIPDLLVGPDSVTWRFSSDSRLYFMMLYPLLLQVAHPVVGAGVNDYSDFEQRPWNRLLRTIDYVTVLVYGGAEAVAMGRRLRAMHKGFRGTREDGKPLLRARARGVCMGARDAARDLHRGPRPASAARCAPTRSTGSTASTAAWDG